MSNAYFLKMIEMLRKQEDILLYDNLFHVNPIESEQVMEFLKKEYTREVLEYPYTAPPFNSTAALWAAQTVYSAAQLMLYRENKDSDIDALFPDYSGEIDASAILSCDLCLRFLPDMLIQLKIIDSDDPLIELLEYTLIKWHYSGINYSMDIETLDFFPVHSDPSLKQLYVNRIVRYKKLSLANHPFLKELMMANLGMFGKEFWNEFK
ncbi:MAG: hypothetical protein H7259_02895, partial [Cytophagales bacterium]|nr:hypothetical protein [Cytophaga sp.]